MKLYKRYSSISLTLMLMCLVFLGYSARSQMQSSNNELRKFYSASVAPSFVKIGPVERKATGKQNWTLLNSVSGVEVHNHFTPSDTSGPAYLNLNFLLPPDVVKSRQFPTLKPLPRNGKIVTATQAFAKARISAEILSSANTKLVFDPQFSPNGQYILFKYGDFNAPGDYRIFVYDIKAGTTSLASDSTVQYYAISWSPDSNYIAFAKANIDPSLYDHGRNDDSSVQMELCISNWRTRKTYSVRRSTSLRAPWTWRGPHGLVYGALSPQDEQFLVDPNYQKGLDFVAGQPIAWERLKGQAKRKPVEPNIYAYSVETQKSSLLIKGGFLPVMSDDGNRVAFIGARDVNHPFSLGNDWKHAASNVCVVSQTLSVPASRKNILETNSNYPSFLWRRDGQHLLIFDQIARSPHAKLTISERDTLSSDMRLITTLESHDPDEFRSPNDPNFTPLSLSADGKHLMVKVDEYFKKNGSYLNQDTLQDVNLATSQVTSVMRVQTSIGIGWKYSK